MNIPAPAKNEYAEYYDSYIKLVNSNPANLLRDMQGQVLTMQSILGEVPEGQENFAYAAGKWTIKQVIGHIVDTERIMAYRVLRFARNDKKELQGFEENDYVKYGGFEKRNLFDLAHEFGVVRESNLVMFKGFDEEALVRTGIANGKEVSVRALIYIMAGHSIHHLNVLRQRYLVELE
jgi:hypothetical protein